MEQVSTTSKTYESVVGDPKFQEWFKDSKVVDGNAKPMLVYHKTTKGFEKFNPAKGQFGNHFGTLEAAEEIKPFRDTNTRFFAVFLNIKKPLRIQGDQKDWGMNVRDLILTNSLYDIDPQLKNELLDQWNTFDSVEEVKELLVRYGYDGIAYQNHYEDFDSASWITFNKNQAWSLYANKPI